VADGPAGTRVKRRVLRDWFATGPAPVPWFVPLRSTGGSGVPHGAGGGPFCIHRGTATPLGAGRPAGAGGGADWSPPRPRASKKADCLGGHGDPLITLKLRLLGSV
jgi:hypothetical protein